MSNQFSVVRTKNGKQWLEIKYHTNPTKQPAYRDGMEWKFNRTEISRSYFDRYLRLAGK